MFRMITVVGASHCSKHGGRFLVGSSLQGLLTTQAHSSRSWVSWPIAIRSWGPSCDKLGFRQLWFHQFWLKYYQKLTFSTWHFRLQLPYFQSALPYSILNFFTSFRHSPQSAYHGATTIFLPAFQSCCWSSWILPVLASLILLGWSSFLSCFIHQLYPQSSHVRSRFLHLYHKLSFLLVLRSILIAVCHCRFSSDIPIFLGCFLSSLELLMIDSGILISLGILRVQRCWYRRQQSRWPTSF